MKQFIKAIDNLPFILKLILCFPALDIVWSVYRLIKSLDKNNFIGVVIAILTIVPGAAFVWLIDFVCVLHIKKVWWIDKF